MPKKFIGTNTKAAAAKEKKSLAKEESEMKKKLVTEESEWLDKCKKIEKKLERREAKIEKREEYLNRKRQLKALLKSESETNKPTEKVTKFDIDNKPPSPSKSKTTDSLIENVNRLTLGEEIARTIDAALSLLGNNFVPDNHPEKRLKAAHKIYEETRIKELRQTNPALKQTQLREIVFKEWLRMQPKP